MKNWQRTFLMAGGGAAPWWLSGGISAANCIAAYQPKGAASLAASYSNLANPGTYDAAPGIAPTWTSGTGWTFNGSTQYLTTGITPTQQTWSMFCRFSGVTGTNGILCGTTLAGGAPPPWFILQPNRSEGKVGYFSGGFLLVAPALTSGNIGVAGNRGYRNGSADAGTIAVSAAALGTIFIGGQNLREALNWPIAGNIQAMAVYDTAISAAQATALSTAMGAL